MGLAFLWHILIEKCRSEWVLGYCPLSKCQYKPDLYSSHKLQLVPIIIITCVTPLCCRYYCLCPLGYEGPGCQVNIDDCEPNQCRNGAVCRDGVNTFTCDCLAGYRGKLAIYYVLCSFVWLSQQRVIFYYQV